MGKYKVKVTTEDGTEWELDKTFSSEDAAWAEADDIEYQAQLNLGTYIDDSPIVSADVVSD